MKKKERRNRLSPEEKYAILKPVFDGKETIKQVAERTGINKYDLMRWRKLMLAQQAITSPLTINTPVTADNRDAMIQIMLEKITEILAENQRLREIIEKKVANK